jgi:drug/metabolite transporter (DMT)-like permease
MQHSREGLVAVHSAVFIFGLTALFSKLIALTALEITLLRSVFAVLAIGVFIRFKSESLTLPQKHDYLVMLLLGILLAAHWVTYFHAMQIASIAVGAIALYTFPVITVFLEPLFHGERPHIVDIISGLAVLFGIYLLVPSVELNNQTTQGVFWGVLSALLFALRNIIQGKHCSHISARHALLYQSMIVVVVLLPFAGNVIPEVSSFQWWQLLLLGIVFTALPHTLFAHSLLYLKAKTTSLVACMQVFYATLFAAIVIGEIPAVTTVAGGVIIVAAAMYESFFRKV